MLFATSLGILACGKVIPEYTGDPISTQGTFRWADDGILYLDLTITNNTNVEIKGAYIERKLDTTRADGYVSTPTSSDGVFQELLASKKGIKAHQSATFTIQIIRHDTTSINPMVSCDYTMTFTRLTFKNYGDMYLTENPLTFVFTANR